MLQQGWISFAFQMAKSWRCDSNIILPAGHK
jgi:hypothetical protein